MPNLLNRKPSFISRVTKLKKQSIPRMPSMLGYQVPLRYVI